MPTVAKRLLDTCAYLDFQRARKNREQPWASNTLRHVSAYLNEHRRLCLSSTTIMEIVQGVRAPEVLRVFRHDVMPTFEIFPFEENAAYIAGEIFSRLEAQGNRIGIPDTQVAAVAIANGLTLVTSNSAHFERVAALGYPLKIENWRNA